MQKCFWLSTEVDLKHSATFFKSLFIINLKKDRVQRFLCQLTTVGNYNIGKRKIMRKRWRNWSGGQEGDVSWQNWPAAHHTILRAYGKAGIRNPEPELEQKRNLRNKNWRHFCLESVPNNNCSIKNFYPHIIFIYCYYIFYCHTFCVRRNIAFFENFIYRIYSINRPGRLLNFWTLRVGAYSRLGAY